MQHQPNANAYLMGYTDIAGAQDFDPDLPTRKEKMK
jgi:hypothetical protein